MWYCVQFKKQKTIVQHKKTLMLNEQFYKSLKKIQVN